MAPPRSPPSARPRRGRAEAGPYARSPPPCQQGFHTPNSLLSLDMMKDKLHQLDHRASKRTSVYQVV